MVLRNITSERYIRLELKRSQNQETNHMNSNYTRSLIIFLLSLFPIHSFGQHYDSSIYARLSFGLGFVNFKTPSYYPNIPANTYINRFVGIEEVRFGGTINRLRISTAIFNTSEVVFSKKENHLLSFDFQGFDIMLGYRWRVKNPMFDELTADIGYAGMFTSTVNYKNVKETSLDSMFVHGANSIVVSRNMYNYLPIEFGFIKYISDPEVWSLSLKVKAFIPITGNNEVFGKSEFYAMTVGLSRKIVYTK